MDLKRSEHKENSKDWWNERYQNSGDQLLYGKEPSQFLVEHLHLIPAKGSVLDIGCGEGRNAVLLAQKGFQVKAIDFSELAIERAKKLASETGVEVEFKVQDLDFFLPALMSVDAVLCSDFVAPKTLQKNLVRGLRPSGILISEAFLMKACAERKNLEAFECMKPGQLLSTYNSSDLQPQYYSEISDEPKAFLVAKKGQVF